MEELATGYGLVEGPRWDARDGSVWFSDVFGGGVFRLAPSGDVETVLEGRRGIGGLALHEAGGVVASGRDLVHVRDGALRDLLAVEGVVGFNDIHTDAEGGVLAGGLRYRPFRNEDPVPGGVWRLRADGTSEELFGGVVWPNGIGLSPDASVVYVSDYAQACVWAWDGGAQARRFARAPEGDACDGLAVDSEGSVWVALGAGGIARFAPGGSLEERIEVPADFTASVSFGGEDMRDLYVATASTLFRTRADVAGLPTPLARV